MDLTLPIDGTSQFVVYVSAPDSDNEEFGGFQGQLTISGIDVHYEGGEGEEVHLDLLCALLTAAKDFLEAHAVLFQDVDGYDSMTSGAVHRRPPVQPQETLVLDCEESS